jgi:hypothetical protein
MAGTTGLEPATSAVTGQRSNQLNYVPELKNQSLRRLSRNRVIGCVGFVSVFGLRICLGNRSMFEKAEMDDAHRGFHEASAAAHEDAADTHDQMCQDCEKAMDAADLNKIQPTQVSAIASPNPANVRMVPRAGMPVPERPHVSYEFEKLFTVDEG